MEANEINTANVEPVIEIENLSFAYATTPVLEDVTFSIPRGDFVCIVGPNGGGKTTLLRLILGLLAPTRGRVRVFGRPPVEVRRRIGYMPQHVQLDPQYPVRVCDVVLMGRLGPGRLGPFGRVDKTKATVALEEAGLAEYAKRPFAALSGGQRQRVLIARALTCEPEILLLDEPTANLDPFVQDEMNELLNELNKRLTVILVSHDVGFVAQYVKTVVCVNRDAVVHQAEHVTGDSIRELYGHGVQMVHHHHPQ
ncbi:MAG: ABC transporter ATP-binding protein [Phycisphaerae bacterium]|nr:ABC transporter ATP-binding protein [Phycisphaerae bacterium]